MAQNKKRDIALGYGALAATCVALAFILLSFAGSRSHSRRALQQYAVHLTPTLVPLLALAAMNTALAVAVVGLARLGRGTKAVLVVSAASVALLAGRGSLQGLLACHAGELAESAKFTPLCGNCRLSFTTISKKEEGYGV